MGASAETLDGFVAGSYTAKNGYALQYRLYSPEIEDGKTYPLIVHLHGAGSWGDNNEAQLGQAKRLVRSDYPAFILAPKTVRPMKWVDLDWKQTGHHQPEQVGLSLEATHELLLKLLNETREIDSSRVYANGQSMGGYGTWDLITRYPEMFAAAVPVCGGGDVEKMPRLQTMPLWVFHGAKDTVVPVQNSRELVAALEAVGNKHVTYTEYPDRGHDAWVPAYNNDQLFSWLFDQRKGK